MTQPAELLLLKEVSTRVGRDMSLVQGAGGNTSVKEGDVLEVYETREIERTDLDTPATPTPAPAAADADV